MMVRSYTKEDIPVINEMGKDLHTNYSFKLDEFSSCLVISNDEIIVGFIVYSIMYDRAEIVDIYIKQIHRKKGYAKELIKEVISICTKNNCNNITLEENEKNIPAINLYKSFNFNIVSIRKKYYEDGSNGYLMEKDLR